MRLGGGENRVLSLTKKKEWVPGDKGHRKESGSKGNADLAQIT